MNATMVASGTKAAPLVGSSIQDIPLGQIHESKTNPRRFFDEAKLAELAAFVPGNKSFADSTGPVGGIERGERNVALVNLEKLARAFRISLSELFRSV